ncbi:hypothetical protein MNBD_CHLOROFLEXI01-885 [hydrothermal vent metagenome]|uniref:Lipoprotein n=1 Tax=hydrothermal vent metagenome TaxID=652676 RepID=A0A3B0UMQ8_9ZZZZ
MTNIKKQTIILAFSVLILILMGCARASEEEQPSSVINTPLLAEATNTIPPEPTNTPLPQTDPVADGDLCSVAGQQEQIDTAFAAYQAARSADADTVIELVDWVSNVSAQIAVACSSALVDLTPPDELADLLNKLQSGGYVVYVRHTHTDRSRGDDDVRLGMCDQQRVLSDQGRDEALLIRNAYQQLDLPVSLLVSTQYCRTLETAVLAFGVPRVILRTDLHATLTDWLATEPEAGTNTFIVAHIGTIRDRVGLDDTFEEGDSLIYRPTDGGGFEYVGRIGLYDWSVLATLNKNR